MLFSVLGFFHHKKAASPLHRIAHHPPTLAQSSRQVACARDRLRKVVGFKAGVLDRTCEGRNGGVRGSTLWTTRWMVAKSTSHLRKILEGVDSLQMPTNNGPMVSKWCTSSSTHSMDLHPGVLHFGECGLKSTHWPIHVLCGFLFWKSLCFSRVKLGTADPNQGP